MHILILGAAGMVGRKLLERLARDGKLGRKPITKATLTGTVDFASSTGDTLVISPESRALTNVYPLYGAIMDFR